MAEIHAALRDHTTGRVTLWRKFWHLLIHRLDSDFFTHAIRACRLSADLPAFFRRPTGSHCAAFILPS
jgi:hypothetical protein